MESSSSAPGLADMGAVAFDGSLGERTRISRCSGLASIKLTLASFKGEYVLAVEEIVQLVGGTVCKLEGPFKACVQAGFEVRERRR